MLHNGWRGHLQVARGRYALAIVIVALSIYLELLLATFAGTRFVFVIFSAAVAACAWIGAGPGLLAVVGALAATDYFLVGPGALFTVDTAVDAYGLGAFAGGGCLLCWVLHSCRKSVRAERQGRATAQRAAEHAQRMAQLANAFASVSSSDEALELAMKAPWDDLRGDAAMLATIAGGTATVARAAGHDDSLEGGTRAPFLPVVVLRKILR